MNETININDTDINLSDFLAKKKEQEITASNKNLHIKTQEKNKSDVKLTKRDINKFTKEMKKEKKENEHSAEEKQLLILKLERYKGSKRFGPLLKKLKINYTPAGLQKKSYEKLEDLHKRILANINNQVNDDIYYFGAEYLLNTYEKLVSTKFNISGTAKSLMMDNSFMDNLEIIKIEYAVGISMPPHIQIILSIILSSFTHYQLNKFSTKTNNSESLENEDFIDEVENILNEKEEEKEKEEREMKEDNVYHE